MESNATTPLRLLIHGEVIDIYKLWQLGNHPLLQPAYRLGVTVVEEGFEERRVGFEYVFKQARPRHRAGREIHLSFLPRTERRHEDDCGKHCGSHGWIPGYWLAAGGLRTAMRSSLRSSSTRGR